MTTDERGQLWRTKRTEWMAWIGAIAIAALLLPLVGFVVRDPDSHLYAYIASRLPEIPVSHWIAPEWWGAWNTEGLFREHPAGIFFLPALIGKIGYPASQAAIFANALYQVLSIVLIQRLAAYFVAPSESRALAWLIQLLPIAFTYRIRANHEQAVLLLLLVALWSTERSRKDGRWIALTAFALLGMLLVKGIFVALGFFACALWILTVRRNPEESSARDRNAWLGLAISAVAVLAAGFGYEAWYRHITHESFMAFYFSRQIIFSYQPHGTPSPFHKLYNFVWYSGRMLWFAFPASIAALAAAWKWRKEFAARFRPRLARAGGLDPRTSDGLVFAVGFSLSVLAGLSLSDREADRYLFCAYYLLGACGMVAAIRAWRPLDRCVKSLDRYHAVVPAAVWLVNFGLTLVTVVLRSRKIAI